MSAAGVGSAYCLCESGFVPISLTAVLIASVPIDPKLFLCDRKAECSVLNFLSHKKRSAGAQDVRWTSALRRPEWNGDRTAAERKHVAKSNPPQAENPAVQDSFLV